MAFIFLNPKMALIFLKLKMNSSERKSGENKQEGA